MFFFYLTAFVLAAAVTVILSVMLFKWLNDVIFDWSGFTVLDVRMIALLFCSISLFLFGGVNYYAASHIAGYCWKGTGKWYGTTSQGESFLKECELQYPPYISFENVRYCDNLLKECSLNKNVEKKDWLTVIFFFGLSAVTFIIPSINALKFGFPGVLGFILQFVLAVLIILLVIIICAVLSGRGSEKSRQSERENRLIALMEKHQYSLK